MLPGSRPQPRSPVGGGVQQPGFRLVKAAAQDRIDVQEVTWSPAVEQGVHLSGHGIIGV